jgi:microcystin degradation protein MlrC
MGEDLRVRGFRQSSAILGKHAIPGSEMKRVGIAGFLHESNTFLPVPTTKQDFEQTSFTQGQALLDRWQGSHHELGGFLEGASTHHFLPVPLLATYAVPSGVIFS